jgi:hypothetical protein
MTFASSVIPVILRYTSRVIGQRPGLPKPKHGLFLV